MKDIVIKDIKRKTNLDRNVLREAAILGYSNLVEDETSNVDVLTVEEERFDYEKVIKADVPFTDRNPSDTVKNYPAVELSEKQEAKRRAQERVDKIRKLRDLKFNFHSADGDSKFDKEKDDIKLHNSTGSIINSYVDTTDGITEDYQTKNAILSKKVK